VPSIRYRPPTRRSTSVVVAKRCGQNQAASAAGSVSARHTRSAGTAKVRFIVSSVMTQPRFAVSRPDRAD
jgi:hypothetical protein